MGRIVKALSTVIRKKAAKKSLITEVNYDFDPSKSFSIFHFNLRFKLGLLLILRPTSRLTRHSTTVPSH
jgi:hypothetical protein